MLEHGNVAAPYVHEFFQKLRQGAAVMTGVCRVVILVEAGQGYGFPAGDTKRSIAEHPLGVDHVTHLDMTRQGVTQHLAVLEVANLVAVEWRGREKLHFLNPVPLQEIYDRWICKFERPRLKALRDLKRRLEEGG